MRRVSEVTMLLPTPPPFLTPTTQHNTTQHNTTQHNATQHNATQRNTTQHIATRSSQVVNSL